MAVLSTEIFAQAYKVTPIQLVNGASDGNANYDGTTGHYSATVSVGADYTPLAGVWFKAITATVAGILRLFASPNTGSTWYLLAEIPTNTVASPGATVETDEHLWAPPTPDPSIKFAPAANWLYKFSSSNNSETWNAFFIDARY